MMSNSTDRKVLFTASTWGHLKTFHLPYFRWFRERGWEVHIACANAADGTMYADRVIDLPFQKQMRSLQNFRAAGILRREIASERYDLITAHTSLAAFFTRLAVKGMRERPKLVNVVHGYLFDDETPAAKRNILLAAERVTAPETDLLLTMNEYDDALAKRYRLGSKIARIPGIGVNFSRLDKAAPEDGIRLRGELGIAKDAFVLLYAAEFSGRKSQKMLVEAMRYLPENVTLVLCGDGALLDECRKLAETRKLGGRVLFPGQIEDMAPWYRMADAAVTASRSEGLPFNVMEAMYMGLPVIASAVKGHVDLIADGETGLLYPYGDAAACAERVRTLMDATALRERLRIRAKADVLRYGLDRVLPEVTERYETLVNAPIYQESVLR